MGRIKSKFVKSAGKKIYGKGTEEFTDDFNKNKEIVAKYAEISSKKLRNVISGYISRLVKQKKEEV